MRESLTDKIRAARQADAKSKCQVAQEVYAHVSIGIEDLTRNLDADVMGENFVAVCDSGCDSMERMLLEICELLNPHLEKMLKILKPRFYENMHRHKKVTWEQVEKRLRKADPKKLLSLSWMEETGGEPDVVAFSKKAGVTFQDRSAESPAGRRNCVYDRDGERQLEQKHPSIENWDGNVVDMAAEMGVDLLDETEYREAQKVDDLDQNSWSWVKTPTEKRKNDIAQGGYRTDGGIGFREFFPRYHLDDGGWRGSLKI